MLTTPINREANQASVVITMGNSIKQQQENQPTSSNMDKVRAIANCWGRCSKMKVGVTIIAVASVIIEAEIILNCFLPPKNPGDTAFFTGLSVAFPVGLVCGVVGALAYSKRKNAASLA